MERKMRIEKVRNSEMATQLANVCQDFGVFNNNKKKTFNIY